MNKLCKTIILAVIIVLTIITIIQGVASAEITTVLTPNGPLTCSTQRGITICF